MPIAAQSKFLGEETILAAELGPFGNQPAQSGRDINRHAVPGGGPVQPAPSA